MRETPLETPLTVKRAAERLEVHEETIRRWIKKGELEAVQVGRTFVISEESLSLKKGAATPDPEPTPRLAKVAT